MRRDLDLVREMLQTVADAPGSVDASAWVTDTRPRELVGYHVTMLRDAGLVRASVLAAGGDPYYSCRVDALTWEGHDYLAAVSDPGVWSHVKRKLAAVGGDAALSVVKQVASAVALELVGL